MSGDETAIFLDEGSADDFGRACRDYLLMRLFGYPRTRVLRGGMMVRRANGLPVTTKASTPVPKSFPIIDADKYFIIGAETMEKSVSPSYSRWW